MGAAAPVRGGDGGRQGRAAVLDCLRDELAEECAAVWGGGGLVVRLYHVSEGV